jgi:DNA-binding NarL/FixJ family response regulator
MAFVTRAVIGASRDLRAPVAELLGFLLAAMRAGPGVCNAECVPMRLVIVDDNHSFLEAARVLLEREGVTVAGVASTGAEALRQAEALRPDVFLVDISLGDESGFDLAQRLVENDRGDRAPVILISTRAEEDVADLLAASPAAGFLAKAELSASAIRSLLDGRAP